MDKTVSHSRNVHSSQSSRYSEKHLRERMENPYWIPKKNSDLFQVKQIFKAEKEIKKNLSLSKLNRKMILDRLHTAQLETNYTYYKDNYILTELTQSDKVLTTTGDEENKSQLRTLLETETNIVNPIHEMEEIKDNIANKEKQEEIIFRRATDQIDHKVKAMKKKKFEGVREFIDKTREIILTKYSMKVREERILRLEETYKNDLESYKDTINDMIRAKKKFENEFLVKFDLYMKHLTLKKEKEKNELTKKEDEKANLEAELKQLENRIQKNKERFHLFKEYRNFQINVKEGITYSQPVTTVTKDPVLGKKNSVNILITQLKNSPFMKSKLQKKQTVTNRAPMPQATFGSLFHSEYRKARLGADVIDEKLNKYKGMKIIFDHPSDLTDRLKVLETSNLKKLEEYNEQISHFIVLDKELKRMEKEENTDDALKHDIAEKTKQLNELLQKKKKLIEEKSKLTAITQQNLSITKHKFLKTKLFSKINEIYQAFPQMFKEKETKKYLSNNTGAKSENELEMLRILERGFDYLFMKFKEFRETLPDDLKDFEKILEINRKKKIAQDQKAEKEKKDRNLEKSVFERQNRVYALSRRKIASDRNKPVKKEKLEVRETKQEDNLNLYELLAFDGDDNYDTKK